MEEATPSYPEDRADRHDRELRLTLALDSIRDSIEDDGDPQHMFDQIVELLRDQFEADACAIVLLEETSDDIEMIAARGLSEGIALDLCRAAMATASIGPIDNPYFNYTLGNQIVMRGLPLGGLVLTRSARPFSEDEQRTLEIAERQIDSAIIQARMICKLTQRNRELEAIYRIDQLRDTLSTPSSQIEAFTEVIRDSFNAGFVLITVHKSAIKGIHNQLAIDDAALDVIESAAAQITIPQTIPTPTGHAGLVLLAAPLQFEHERLGSVIIGRQSVFTVGDHRLLYALISQIDSAVKESLAAESLETKREAAHSLPRPPLNSSIRYVDDRLMIDQVDLADIIASVGSPTYVYSLKRVADNLAAIRHAFLRAGIDSAIHYSAKANGCAAILRTVGAHGAGIDAVSAGEIYKALRAGIAPDHIVFAGVGKTHDELTYAVQQRIGWINLENEAEAERLEAIASQAGVRMRCALRLNPNVAANTHRHIATGHGAAKFGLSEPAIRSLLANSARFPHLEFAGIHVHIGSQLRDHEGTQMAVAAAVELAHHDARITTINIGGGFPVAYHADDPLPHIDDFVRAVAPLVRGYHLMIEPGRSIVADAGVLLATVEYIKDHGDQRFVILDTGMTELMRPALYEAHHSIIPVTRPINAHASRVAVVGPVCESTDILLRDWPLGDVHIGERLAILTAGAYGMVMASNYNARLKPAEVAVAEDGESWRVVSRRETLDDLLRLEQ